MQPAREEGGDVGGGEGVKSKRPAWPLSLSVCLPAGTGLSREVTRCTDR